MNPNAMEYMQPVAERNHMEQVNQDANTFIQEKKKFCDKISSLEFSQTTAQIGQLNEQHKAAQIDEIHAE
jgi:tRNA G37 N-methylase Trm5